MAGSIISLPMVGHFSFTWSKSNSAGFLLWRSRPTRLLILFATARRGPRITKENEEPPNFFIPILFGIFGLCLPSLHASQAGRATAKRNSRQLALHADLTEFYKSAARAAEDELEYSSKEILQAYRQIGRSCPGRKRQREWFELLYSYFIIGHWKSKML